MGESPRLMPDDAPRYAAFHPFSGSSTRIRAPQGRQPGPLDGHPPLCVEVPQQALEVAKAGKVEGREVNAVGPPGGSGDLGP